MSDAVRLRQAGDANLHERVNKLTSLVKARALREDAEIAAVFVHEDFDEIDSGKREQVRGRVQRALNSKLSNAFYILAVWEIEAWLLLLPEAISATRRSWVLPQKYHGKDTGRVRDPKRVMMREVSIGGPRYRESDAPTVIKKAAELALLRSLSGKNSSWEEFIAYVDAWCIARKR
ncbi:hypothetical protein [Amycolatopsis tolypomycina]|uniref:hypothetical protein n=1 Tax=Amycolatopsis tolypomycina TaxID=208445 RepID=UPI0033B0DB36